MVNLSMGVICRSDKQLFSLKEHHSWVYTNPLNINQEDVSIPIFDTTQIHSKAAVVFALAK
jgi:hypothetical protein